LDQKKEGEILYDLAGSKIDEKLRRVYSRVTNELIDLIKQERLTEVYHFCFIPDGGVPLKGFTTNKGEITANVLVIPGSQALANGLLNFLLSDKETGRLVVKATKLYWQWQKKKEVVKKEHI